MKIIMRSVKRVFIILFITLFLAIGTVPIYASEHVSNPETPSTPQSAVTPAAPAQPSQPKTPSNPATPAQPQSSQTPQTASDKASPTPSVVPTNQLSNGNVGNTAITTGSVTNTSTVSTIVNSNSANGTGGNGSGSSASNSNNGDLSKNSASASNTSNSSVSQVNNASVSGGASSATVTGQNSASRNVGNSTITTGDANTSGTLISALNTNTAGMSVSEFNVSDNRTGDIVLDFAKNCISGCPGSSTSAAQNTLNGPSSTNSATIANNSQSATVQMNAGSLNNALTLSSNSGDNFATKNTGGNSKITTGNANVSANALSFLNNNIAGNVQFGVVNIYGTLNGDIVLPNSVGAEQCVTCLGSSSLTAVNTQNGVNSTNNGNISNQSNDTLTQTNSASIENNLKLSASSGKNVASRNTNGNSSVASGNASTQTNILNIANSNISSGNWWLVIVNKAGQWIGQILGAPDGATFAGSSGTNFTVDKSGQITATNNGNGDSSKNTSSVLSDSDTSLSQQNIAQIVNNLSLSANTGGNYASRNTGGDNTIQTGDAKIIANLVNFVNNNIKGKGNLVVTMVNVFGNWFGDFVTPGTTQRSKSQAFSTQVASSDPPAQQGSLGNNTSQNNSQGSSDSHFTSNTAQTTGATQPSQSSIPEKALGAVLYANTHAQMEGKTVLVSDAQAQKGSVAVTLVKAVKGVTDGNKVIGINLAWLLLLPAVYLILSAAQGVYGIFRKKISEYSY